MRNKTKEEYLRLAEYFLVTRMEECEPITPKRIREALMACAVDYRPAYWRRLRRALVIHQNENGFSKSAHAIGNLQNPVTSLTSGHEYTSKKKQKRVKSVSEDEHKKLTTYIKEQADLECLAAVLIVHFTGCRPAEIETIKMLPKNSVKISSVKKTDTRGLDRTLQLTSSAYRQIELLLPYISRPHPDMPSKVGTIQRRLQRYVRNLWPSRRYRVSLYSYRHQMGSDLKASNLSRVEVSAIMGHQSVDSIDVYGDKRKSIRNPSIKASNATVSRVRKRVHKCIRISNNDYSKLIIRASI